MFLLYIFVFVLLVAASLFYFNRKEETDVQEGWKVFSVVLCVIDAVFLLVTFIVNLSNYSDQISSFEKLRKVNERIDILNTRYSELSTTFTLHLSKEYPGIEKEIFSKLSPSSSNALKIYLANYPEIKSSSTLSKLVDDLKLIADDMYGEKLSRQSVCQEIRFRYVNPWIMFKKEIPEDIKPVVYSIQK
jgi:hypothetical protein